MPRQPIDLDALRRILGRPPRRYGKGDPRNSLRAIWIQRATSAVADVLRRNDNRRPGRVALLRIKAPIPRPAGLYDSATHHTLSDTDTTSQKRGAP